VAKARKKSAAKKASARKSARKTSPATRKRSAPRKGAKKSSRRTSRAKAAAAPKRRDSVDAISLLKADHRAVEDLFAQYESASGAASKQRLARQICQELIIHALIEEELFYPAVKPEIEKHLIEEAHVEHDGAKVLIAELLAGSPSDEFYDAKVKVLSEEIKHHVKEEEQRDGIFAQSKQADLDLVSLGEALEQRKQDYKRLFDRNGLPTPETRTLRGAKVKIGRPVR
jgi:hypothetical protein